jgi:hypothetical protein
LHKKLSLSGAFCAKPVKGLTRLARKHGVRLRQSYVRIAKRAAMMAARYAHAKQFNPRDLISSEDS